MMRSLYSGITGLQGFQTDMDVIGNNIANVNTVGFKSSRVTFSTALYQALSAARGAQNNVGGVNPEEVGLGTQIASVDQLMGQGSLQNTGNKTDLAIQGDGFFMVNSGTGNYYTRAGNFSLDSDGTLVQSGTGYKVMGWESTVDSTGKRQVNTNNPVTPIQISANETMAAKATTTMGVTGNLDSTTGIQPTTITVTSNNGQKYTVQFTFNLDQKNFDPFSNQKTYDWTAKIVSAPSGATIGNSVSGQMTLDQYGNVVNDNANNLYITQSGNTYGLSTNSSTSSVSGTAISLPTSGGISFAEADNTANTTTATYTDPTYTTSTQIYDSLGNAHTVYIDFTNLGTVSGSGSTTTWGGSGNTNTAWAWDARLSDGTPVTLTNASGTAVSSTTGVIEFNSSGKPTGNFTLSNGSLTQANAPTGISFSTSDGSNPVSSQIDLTQISDLAGSASASITSQNGNAEGTIQSYAINDSGQIIGTFSNGLTDTLGQVALANFNNPAGLNAIGSSLYSESANSGTPQVGTASTGGRGSLVAGALEMSNVSLANEFSNMIVAERSFQANSKVITTSDTMIQDLVNLKQTP